MIGVVSAGNAGSIRVLEKVGMRFERMYPMNPGEPEVRLYGRTLEVSRLAERASAALDFVADHRADLSALVDAQLDGPVEAQFALDHAGGADVHFGLVCPGPSPSSNPCFS